MERGIVTSVMGSEATVILANGSERVITVPAMIHVAVGTRLTIDDSGKGEPVYKWGS